MKLASLLISLMLFCELSKAQDPNIFYSEPDEIKQFLEKNYKKIEVQIVRYRTNGIDKIILGSRIIEFKGDTFCRVIDRQNEGESDTTFYRYDQCGKVIEKKGHAVNSRYFNRYKNCRLISRESNEMELVFSSLGREWNVTRYVYDKEGKLVNELTYSIADTNIMTRSTEYKYKGASMDSLNEYYYDEDGVKMKNRLSKYFYSAQLDSVHYYNFQSILIDKIAYRYHPSGKVRTINGGTLGFFEYKYNDRNEPIVISRDSGLKEYLIEYFE